MTGTRRIPRYDVDAALPIIAFPSDMRPVRYELKTLSLKGCGIYIDFAEAKNLQKEEVHLLFRMGKRRLKLRGLIIYCIHLKGGENFL